jgi:hypothetical protein
MPHVYRDARLLDGKPKLGDFECVYLVKLYTGLGWTGAWREGERVVGNKSIAIGTAIATFVDGAWPGLAHGNHSGFYMGQVSNGIYILDQWPNMATKPVISKRFIYRHGKDKSGKYIRPTENADAFSIIE